MFAPVLGEPAIPPSATEEVSKYNCSPSVYAEPPSTILTAVTDPPDTVTSAVAPSQTADDGTALVLNNLILK